MPRRLILFNGVLLHPRTVVRLLVHHDKSPEEILWKTYIDWREVELRFLEVCQSNRYNWSILWENEYYEQIWKDLKTMDQILKDANTKN